MKKIISFPIAIIIIVVLVSLVGVVAWQYGFIPEIKIPFLTPSSKLPEVEIKEPITSFSALEAEEVEKIEDGEIAFLQSGDVWLLSKDLERKSKVIDTEEEITQFSFSPDGKDVYWLNNKGELWKKEGQVSVALVSVEQDMEEAIQETYGLGEPFFYMKGKVLDFWLSPDGNYIAYTALEEHTSCCMAPPTVPVATLRIMKKDATEKVIAEKPLGIRDSLLRVEGWLPDSKNVLFYFTAPDTGISHSPFFEVGLKGQAPKLYTEIFRFFRQGVEIDPEDLSAEDISNLGLTVTVGEEPVYSPTGKKIAYLKYTDDVAEKDTVRLKDINTKETKTILENVPLEFGLASRILSWSKDGNLLLVRSINKVFIFNKEGDIVFERKFGEMIPGSPGLALIDSVLLSLDSKYLGGVYKTEKEKPARIFFENILTRERKEFELPELEYPEKEKNVWLIYIYPQFFSKIGNFYYRRNLPYADTGELWVIDTNIWKNYKVFDIVSQVIGLP